MIINSKVPYNSLSVSVGRVYCNKNSIK
jgi:hypothetical protein